MLQKRQSGGQVLNCTPVELVLISASLGEVLTGEVVRDVAEQVPDQS